MGTVDPLVKTSVIAAINRLQETSQLDSANIKALADLYDVAESNVRRWARLTTDNIDPSQDKRKTGKAPELGRDIKTLLVRHGSMKGAWAEAHAANLYPWSYQSFTRACNRLDPALLAGLLRGRQDMIDALPVMAYPVAARNEVWAIDHTQSDVRIVHNRTGTIIRPWVTVIRDKGTRAVMAVRYTPERVNSHHFLATLASAILGYTPTGQPAGTVGGRPASVLVDNGAENTAEHVVKGLLRLGTTVLPTTPGHSWQNGSAENIIGIFQRQFERIQPGYVASGKTVTGSMRAVADTYAEQDVDTLLHLDVLQQRAQQWAIAYNTTAGADGNAPVSLWLDDPTTVDFPSEAELRWALLKVKGLYAVTKNGMSVNKIAYQSADLTRYIGRGKLLTVRHLPGATEWIDVWDGDTYICRAWAKSSLPPEEQNKITARRRSISAQVNAAEKRSQAMRDTDADNAVSDSTDPSDPLECDTAAPVRKRDRTSRVPRQPKKRSDRPDKRNRDLDALVIEKFAHLTNHEITGKDSL